MSEDQLTPVLMSKSKELVNVVEQPGTGKKRKVQVVDKSAGLEGYDSGAWMSRERGQKWSLVYDKITRHRDRSKNI